MCFVCTLGSCVSASAGCMVLNAACQAEATSKLSQPKRTSPAMVAACRTSNVAKRALAAAAIVHHAHRTRTFQYPLTVRAGPDNASMHLAFHKLAWRRTIWRRRLDKIRVL